MNNLASGKRLVLVDGSGFIFRAYHALPPLKKSDGTPTGAVSGYCNMLFKILNEMEKGSKKENYFSEKERIIISNFLNKILGELKIKSN